MNSPDFRMFDKWCCLKISARGWALIRQLAETRRPRRPTS